VWRTNAFRLAGAAEHADLLSGRTPGYCHGRVGNPTADAFAAALASLEGHRVAEAVEGEAFASGMAAATAVLLAFTGADAHVVAPAVPHADLHGLLSGLLARFGVETSFVDTADCDAVRAAIRPGTRLVWSEPMARIRRVRVETGAGLAPDEAFLLRRGLETLPLRVRRQCDSANMFAAAVARHPAVRAVDYPGLPGHSRHEHARALFDAGPEGTRFGAVVTVTPFGGRRAGPALVDALRLVSPGSSLGGTHTHALHVASTTHRCHDDDALRSAGIDPGAVRFSIGLEDVDDLVRDVTEALDSVRGMPEPSDGVPSTNGVVADTR
jgi:cystathionine beta-lyase/cystathionine gamma-synthase